MSSFILQKVINLFFSQTSPDHIRLKKQAIIRDKTTFIQIFHHPDMLTICMICSQMIFNLFERN